MSEWPIRFRGGPLDGAEWPRSAVNSGACLIVVPLNGDGQPARLGDQVSREARYRERGLYWYFEPSLSPGEVRAGRPRKVTP